MESEQAPIEELLAIMRRLRDPANGCPWDIQQSFATIAPFTIEEAYEVADAIERDDMEDLQDELGDLLLQIVFHACIAAESKLFDFDDVARSIVNKMLRRHPHVFGDATFVDMQQFKASWEAGKALERGQKARRRSSIDSDQGNETTATSALDGVAVNLPALIRAEKLQKRAARIGFDWPADAPVWDKLAEEIAEVQEAEAQADQNALEDELGDVLFTVVNLARRRGVDAETALRRANAKFERRFRHVEQLASERSLIMTELNIADLDRLWDEAKQILAKGKALA